MRLIALLLLIGCGPKPAPTAEPVAAQESVTAKPGAAVTLQGPATAGAGPLELTVRVDADVDALSLTVRIGDNVLLQSSQATPSRGDRIPVKVDVPREPSHQSLVVRVVTEAGGTVEHRTFTVRLTHASGIADPDPVTTDPGGRRIIEQTAD